MSSIANFAADPFAAALGVLIRSENPSAAPLGALLNAIVEGDWRAATDELHALCDLPCGVDDSTLDLLLGWAMFNDTTMRDERRFERAKLAWNRVVQRDEGDAMYVAAASSLGWVYAAEGQDRHAKMWRKVSARSVDAALAA